MLEGDEVFAVALASKEESIILLPQMTMIIIKDNDSEAHGMGKKGGRKEMIVGRTVERI